MSPNILDQTMANATASTASGKVVPTFIGIGPGKCGTTWLYNACRNHPDVCLASAKETLYFEDYFDKGIDWYLRFFSACTNPNGSRAIGEISNTYIFSAAAAERIKATFPEVKIVFSLRDPIERAFSHYLFLRRNGEVNGSFEECLEVWPSLLTRSLYAKHLKPYYQLFDEQRRLCLFFDDLKSDPHGYANAVFRFLEVDPIKYQGDPAKRVLSASTPRNRWMAKAVVSAAGLVRRLGRPDVVTRVKNSAIPKLIFRPFKSNEAPKLSTSTRQKYVSYFQEDLEELSEMTGRNVKRLWGYESPSSIKLTREIQE